MWDAGLVRLILGRREDGELISSSKNLLLAARLPVIRPRADGLSVIRFACVNAVTVEQMGGTNPLHA